MDDIVTNVGSKVFQQALRSMKWALFASVLPKFITPLASIVLARLLVPEDFGVVGISMSIIVLANQFQEKGLSQALIQREENIEDTIDVVFWSSITLGIILAGLLVLLTPWIAEIFHEPRLTHVLYIMSLSIVITSFSSVQNALLQRGFQFRVLFRLTVVPVLVPFVVAIPLALAGVGYWALVASMLVGMALKTVLLWRYSHWRPRFRFNMQVARPLLAFGLFVTLESVQGWAIVQGDKLIVGNYFNMQIVGHYVLGTMLIMMIFGSIMSSFTSVLYPVYCRIQNQEAEMVKRFFLEVTSIFSAIVIPLALGIAFVATPLVTVAFGPKWTGLDLTLVYLGIGSLSWINTTFNPNVYKALGRPDVMPKFIAITLLYIIPSYLIAGKFGYEWFLRAKLSADFLFIAHAWLAGRLLKLPADYFWRCIRCPLLSSLLMGGVLFTLLNLLGPYSNGNWLGWIKLATVLASGATSYCLSLWLIDKALCLRMIQLVRKII